MQGRSIIPILKGQTPADWRQAFYYEYYEFPTPHRVQPHEGVVTDRYKLVRYFGPGLEKSYSELFDLKTDPQELTSVYDEPALKSVREELEQQLAKLKTELRVPDPIPGHWYGQPAK